MTAAAQPEPGHPTEAGHRPAVDLRPVLDRIHELEARTRWMAWYLGVICAAGWYRDGRWAIKPLYRTPPAAVPAAVVRLHTDEPLLELVFAFDALSDEVVMWDISGQRNKPDYPYVLHIEGHGPCLDPILGFESFLRVIRTTQPLG